MFYDINTEMLNYKADGKLVTNINYKLMYEDLTI